MLNFSGSGQRRDASADCWPLDDLVGQDVPTLMKIDVEGHELSVLRGGGRTLRDARLLVAVMTECGLAD